MCLFASSWCSLITKRDRHQTVRKKVHVCPICHGNDPKRAVANYSVKGTWLKNHELCYVFKVIK